MTSRRLLVEKEYMKVNISVGKALEGRDALAKEVSHPWIHPTRTTPILILYVFLPYSLL